MSDPFPAQRAPKSNKEERISPVSDEPVISVQEIKDLYLFGIPLEAPDGNTLPDRTIEFYINAAQQRLERELDIIIRATAIEQEQHDFYLIDYTQWGFLTLYKRPVFEVTSLFLNYGVQRVLEFPDDWIKLNGLTGEIHLFPTVGSLGTFAVGEGGTFLPLLTRRFAFAPSMWEANYICGWPVKDIPQDLKDAIGKLATISILNVLGDILLGAGIANQSISIDGLSQSIGTTQSAENNAYSARVRMYQSELKEYIKVAKGVYKGPITIVA